MLHLHTKYSCFKRRLCFVLYIRLTQLFTRVLFCFTSGVPRLWEPKASTSKAQTLAQRVGRRGQLEAVPHLRSGRETHHCCWHQPGPTGEKDTTKNTFSAFLCSCSSRAARVKHNTEAEPKREAENPTAEKVFALFSGFRHGSLAERTHNI